MKKNKIKKILMITGTMLIMSALFLCLYNMLESRQAYENSQEVLTELKDLIPEPRLRENKTDIIPSEKDDEPFINPADDLFAPYKEADEPQDPPSIELDDEYYCGYVFFPSLGLELPVTDGWSYAALKNAPCRYSGSAAGRDMIIAAHNYNSHFGRIGELDPGDEIFFTDTSGLTYRYEVDHTEYVDGYDIDAMFSGQEDQWDITLFTCTLNGQSRVTVRALLDE